MFLVGVANTKNEADLQFECILVKCFVYFKRKLKSSGENVNSVLKPKNEYFSKKQCTCELLTRILVFWRGFWGQSESHRNLTAISSPSLAQPKSHRRRFLIGQKMVAKIKQVRNYFKNEKAQKTKANKKN